MVFTHMLDPCYIHALLDVLLLQLCYSNCRMKSHSDVGQPPTLTLCC